MIPAIKSVPAPETNVETVPHKRNVVAVAFHIILYPGILLALTVLAINLLGDGLRDALDPRLARQL